MLLTFLHAVAVVGALFVVLMLVVLCCFEIVGNTYRDLPVDVRRELRSATFYHYFNAALVDQHVDAGTGMVTLRRRSRTIEPYLTGRRAVYMYTAHGPRGARSNHPKRWRSSAAVITIAGADLLEAVGNAKVKYRRHDCALAVLGDYHGPGRLVVRSGNVIKLKNDPNPPGHHAKGTYS